MAKETVEVPISGKIISVEVKVGDVVKEGDTLCVIESMKMQNPIMAPVAGTIKEVGVSTDKTVREGELVAIIEY